MSEYRYCPDGLLPGSSNIKTYKSYLCRCYYVREGEKEHRKLKQDYGGWWLSGCLVSGI